jgi:hypothetical protein
MEIFWRALICKDPLVVTPLVLCAYVSIGVDKMKIDPKNLLVAEIGNIESLALVQFEQCSHPSSLFNSDLLMQAADRQASGMHWSRSHLIVQWIKMPTDRAQT